MGKGADACFSLNRHPTLMQVFVPDAFFRGKGRFSFVYCKHLSSYSGNLLAVLLGKLLILLFPHPLGKWAW